MLQSETVKKYDTYKDSGIEWIGEIPQEWTARKLFGLLKSIGSGTTPKGNDNYYDGDISWLNTGDLTDSYINIIGKTVTNIAMAECSALKLFDKDSVVIAMYGATIGKLGILTFPTTTNQACCVMSCGNKLNNKYLFYVLYSARDYILTLSYGAGQPNISQETMKAFKLCCPNINEQQIIAEYLDKKCGEIDRVIETEKAVIEKLIEYKQSIITEAVTKGLDKSAPLKDSGIEWIGKIPQHWEVKRTKYTANSFDKGNGITKEDVVADGDIQCIRYGEIYSKYDRQCTECVSATNLDKISSPKHISKGNILFAGTGELIEEIGKNIVYMGDKPCLAGGDIIILNHNQNPIFLNYALNSIYSQSQKSYGKVKLKVVHISASAIGDIRIAIPPLEEQQQIAEYLDKKCSEIDKAISDKDQVIEKFTEYKKSLIYECVTGKRKVV